MKKYFALIISLLVILTCFTACKPKIKNGTVITDAGGQVYAAVTQENGGIARDEAGNLLVLVTDANGRNVKGDDGEYLTNPVAIKNAIVIGNQVECQEFSATIPNGWSNAHSTTGLSIKKDNSDKALVIDAIDKTLDDAVADVLQLIGAMKSTYPDTVYVNTTETLGKFETKFISAYVPDTGTTSSYLAYYFFENDGTIYSCRITSAQDIGNDLGEFKDIISSITFR